jgi:small-conductance mechanosensitive channel
MESLLSQIEWVPVVVSFFVTFAVAWAWYSPMLFATGWMAGIGIAPDDNSPMAKAFTAQIIGTVLFAIIVNLVTVPLAVLIGLALACIVTANGLFSQKSRYAIMTEAGYLLVMIVIMIVVNLVL